MALIFFLTDSIFLLLACLLQPTSQEFSSADFQIPVPRPLQFFVDQWVSIAYTLVAFIRPPPHLLSSFSYSDYVTAFECGINWALILNNTAHLPLQLIIPFGLIGVFSAMGQTYAASLSINWAGKAVLVEREEAWANFSQRIMARGKKQRDFVPVVRQFLESFNVGACLIA